MVGDSQNGQQTLSDNSLYPFHLKMINAFINPVPRRFLASNFDIKVNIVIIQS